MAILNWWSHHGTLRGRPLPKPMRYSAGFLGGSAAVSLDAPVPPIEWVSAREAWRGFLGLALVEMYLIAVHDFVSRASSPR